MSLLDALANLFRPNHKNSDPEVRAEAVRVLDDAHPSDHAALEFVLRSDPEARVRRLALKKIADPAILDSAASAESDEGTHDEVGDEIFHC